MSEKSSRFDDPYLIREMTTRVNLKSNQLSNVNNNLLKNLKDKVEGRNHNNCYIVPDSSVIIKRSNGYFGGNHLTGEMTYDVSYLAEVCCPMKEDIIYANIANINEAGILLNDGPMVIFTPKDYKNNVDFFDKNISIGSKLKLSVIDSKCQPYDNSIYVICEILDIIDDNVYIENDNNKVSLNTLKNLDLEIKNGKSDNEGIFGFDSQMSKLDNVENDDVIAKGHVNKLELVNPHPEYHEHLKYKYNNNSGNMNFELMELNYYYDFINENNNTENYIVLNDVDDSISNGLLQLRNEFDADGKKTFIYSNQKSKLNAVEKLEKYDAINSDLIIEFVKDDNLIKILENALISLKTNGTLILKINPIFNTKLYKELMIISYFFNEIHICRPDVMKDYENKIYVVFKYFKNGTKDDLNNIKSLSKKDYNDFKNINLEKFNIKDILVFNNRNVKNIYYKTMLELKNIKEIDDTKKMKTIAKQREEALKWYSKFAE